MNADGAHQRRLTPTRDRRGRPRPGLPTGADRVRRPEPAAAAGHLGRRRGRPEAATADERAGTHPSWSPDGSEIAFSGSTPRRRRTASSSSRRGRNADGSQHPRGPGVLGLPSRPGRPTGAGSSSSATGPTCSELDLWADGRGRQRRRRVTNTASRDEHDPAGHPTAGGSSTAARAFHGASSSQLYVSTPTARTAAISRTPAASARAINDDPSWQPLR